MRNSIAIIVAISLLSPFAAVVDATQADDTSFTIGPASAGATPFIANVQLTVTPPSSLKSIQFTVVPKAGSVTRPLSATYSRNYLARQGKLDAQTGKITLPIFGLYANYNNTVILKAVYNDGSSKQSTVTGATAVFDDPCEFNTPTVRQARTATTELSYDFILVASNCGQSSPTVLDTDGAVRWVGTAGVAHHTTAFYDNAMYQAAGTRLLRIELDGTVNVLADYSDIGVVGFTHNLDRGKYGLIADVDTVNYVETENIEIDKSGKVIKRWNLAAILSAAMIAGGDDPTQFIRRAKGNYAFGSPEDWWHNNSVTYRQSDDSLLISSRENFVICLDYESGAIKWIFGDTTKQWYQFPSLRKYALATGPSTVAPDGQHALSITHDNDLLLMDNGRESQHHSPAGPRRNTATRKYALDLQNKVATQVWVYPPASTVFSEFCSSIYEDAPENYLIDYAQLSTPNGRVAEIFGLTAAGNKVFDYSYPTGGCEDAYRSLPLHWENLIFDVPSNSQLTNISTRASVEAGDKVSIAGFIVTGTSKPVVVRGLGPSLKINNVPLDGRLMNPTLDLYNRSGVVLRHNDNYKDSPGLATIAANNLLPTDDREAALSMTLQPGAYTAVLRGLNNTSGISLVEVYDIAQTNGSRLVNLSTRGVVASGDKALIGGLILQGTNPRRLLFRAIGPELQASGVADALQDTTIELVDAEGTQVAANDDWRQAANASDIEATGVQPKDDRESAMLASLPTGSYTVIVRSKDNMSGTALVEAYQLD